MGRGKSLEGRLLSWPATDLARVAFPRPAKAEGNRSKKKTGATKKQMSGKPSSFKIYPEAAQRDPDAR